MENTEFYYKNNLISKYYLPIIKDTHFESIFFLKIFEDFLEISGTDLCDYYKYVVLSFYNEISIYNKNKNFVDYNNVRISVFMHDILTHQYYGHSFDVIGDLSIYEGRNEIFLKVPEYINKYNIVRKYARNSSEFLLFLERTDFYISENLKKTLNYFSVIINCNYSELNIELSNILSKKYFDIFLNDFCSKKITSEIEDVVVHIKSNLNLRSLIVFYYFEYVKLLLESVLYKKIIDKKEQSKIADYIFQKTEILTNDFYIRKLDFSDGINLCKRYKIENFASKKLQNENLLLEILLSKDVWMLIKDRFDEFKIDYSNIDFKFENIKLPT